MNGSNVPVSAADLGPVAQSMRATWQERCTQLLSDAEAASAADADEGDEQGEPPFTEDTPGGRLRVVWKDVAVGEEGMNALRASGWQGGSAVFEEGTLPLPQKVGTYRVAFRAAGEDAHLPDNECEIPRLWCSCNQLQCSRIGTQRASMQDRCGHIWVFQGLSIIYIHCFVYMVCAEFTLLNTATLASVPDYSDS